jgi:hypothetical protein
VFGGIWLCVDQPVSTNLEHSTYTLFPTALAAWLSRASRVTFGSPVGVPEAGGGVGPLSSRGGEPNAEMFGSDERSKTGDIQLSISLKRRQRRGEDATERCISAAPSW